jgi:hypothetical protein
MTGEPPTFTNYDGNQAGTRRKHRIPGFSGRQLLLLREIFSRQRRNLSNWQNTYRNLHDGVHQIE